jgi:predicted lysophospholipase L1 biosynthesis ABC-type transport system permease subunit
MSWKTILAFVLFATLSTSIVGWLTATEILPLRQMIRYSDAERNFLRIWLVLAIVIGVIVPAIAWFVWRDRLIYRQILGFYLATLVIQIATEQIVSSIVFPSLVVTIGTLYTLFRLWQIWRGYQLIQTVPENSSMSGLLGLLGLFWFGNTIFLVTVGWPSIWSQN